MAQFPSALCPRCSEHSVQPALPPCPVSTATQQYGWRQPRRDTDASHSLSAPSPCPLALALLLPTSAAAPSLPQTSSCDSGNRSLPVIWLWPNTKQPRIAMSEPRDFHAGAFQTDLPTHSSDIRACLTLDTVYATSSARAPNSLDLAVYPTSCTAIAFRPTDCPQPTTPIPASPSSLDVASAR